LPTVFFCAEGIRLSMSLSNKQLVEKLTTAQQLYQKGKLNEAVTELNELIIHDPQQLYYYDFLADIYGRQNNWQAAADCYELYLQKGVDSANAYFNYAYNLKQAGQYQLAIENYQTAINKNIEQPEEVYLNMAVIYSDHLRQEEKAKQALQAALSINANYVSALYNLANLYEEEGDKQQATLLFEKVLVIEPTNYQSLARLADVKKFTENNDPVINKLKYAIKSISNDPSTKINLLYALGKVLDDCAEYNDAFDYYRQANHLDSQTMPCYNKAEQELIVDKNIQLFSNDWFSKHREVSSDAPIFICGMFRSGSTLTEQILASHPEITAGGERDYFDRLIKQKLQPYPEALSQLNALEMDKIRNNYLSELAQAFPDAHCVTDKRPDNFLYIGLIKSLFPHARIIHSTRNPLDNCLSVFFLRLGASMNYATALSDTVHYYKQQIRLMDHWKSLFPDSIFEANYDQLVINPESAIKTMLNFIELEWNEQCLDFHHLKNRVKTASVWRVRQPLYSSSSGRWHNYKSHIDELINEIEAG